MSTNTTQPRQPKGQPTGGEFAAKHRSDDTIDSLTASPDFGSVAVTVGSSTPWGRADSAEQPAAGIAIVSTASHGGVKLSPQRNRMIPAPLRNSDGWYEEDCEAAIVTMAFPDDMSNPGDDVFMRKSGAEQTVKDWFPEAYEEAFGVELGPGVSRMKDKLTFDRANENNHVARAAWGSGQQVEGVTVPDGSVLVATRRASDGAETHFLVPKDEYAARGDFGFVIDPSRHTQISQIGDERAAKRAAEVAATTPATGLREPQRAGERGRLNRELDKRWRDPDTGEVFTMRQRITGGNYHAKTVLASNGKRSYYLRPIADDGGPDNHIVPVSKALWDAYDGPDDRDEQTVAEQDFRIAVAKHEKSAGRRSQSAEARSLAAVAHARARLDQTKADAR